METPTVLYIPNRTHPKYIFSLISLFFSQHHPSELIIIKAI